MTKKVLSQGELVLTAADRYRYFLDTVAAWEEAWGLRTDAGWAMANTSAGKMLFPIWPAEEFARVCAVRDWAGHEPDRISARDVIDELSPLLRKDNIHYAVLPLPDMNGVTRSPSELADDLELALEERVDNATRSKVVSTQELANVLKLDAARRYRYFVNNVADWEHAWGLMKDGEWASAACRDGVAMPLWPAEAYARAAATGDWAGHTVTRIEIEDLMAEVCPALEDQGSRVAVFPGPSDLGTVKPQRAGQRPPDGTERILRTNGPRMGGRDQAARSSDSVGERCRTTSPTSTRSRR